MEEWTEILNNPNTVGIAEQAEAMKELADTYSDFLNLSQESVLSESFLTDTNNLKLMQEALEGNIDSYIKLLYIAT